MSEPNTKEILEKFDRESVVRTLTNNKIALFVTSLAILYSLFHLYNTYYPMPELKQRVIHVGLGVALIFLIYPAGRNSDRSRISLIDWALFLLSLASTGYLLKEYQEIVTTRGGIPTQADIGFAILTVVLVLEASRRITGWILPILSLIFLVYPFISHFEGPEPPS